MIKLLSVFRQLLSYRGVIKLCFSTPEKKDVLLVDPAGIKSIGYALPNENFNLCYVRPAFGEMIIYASPKIIMYSVVNYFRSGAGSMVLAYMLGLIDATRPKVVIENIHFPILLRAAQLRPKVSFLTVLNGYWLNGSDLIYGGGGFHKQLARIYRNFPARAENYHVVTFGEKDIEIFNDEGLGGDCAGIKYHPFGSMLGDYAYRKYIDKEAPIKYDIVWISQAASESIRGTRFVDNLLVGVTKKAFAFLVQYAKDRQLSILVHLRSDPNDDQLEQHFYAEMADGCIELAIRRNDERPLSVYYSASLGRMICSIHSTVGFECLAWRKKVAFFLFDFDSFIKISSNRHASDVELWPWIFVGLTAEMATRLDDLLLQTDADYLENLQNYQPYLIHADSEGGADQSIRALVDSMLQ